MAWIRKTWRRMRNGASDGDYPGGHRGNGPGRPERRTRAAVEAKMYRPDSRGGGHL